MLADGPASGIVTLAEENWKRVRVIKVQTIVTQVQADDAVYQRLGNLAAIGTASGNMLLTAWSAGRASSERACAQRAIFKPF